MALARDLSLKPESALLPHLVDRLALEKPDAIYVEYPKSATSYDDGFYQITFRDFANVINGLTWWLTKNLGPGNGEVLPYIGPNDVRYPALVLATVKAGYAVRITSRHQLWSNMVLIVVAVLYISEKQSRRPRKPYPAPELHEDASDLSALSHGDCHYRRQQIERA